MMQNPEIMEANREQAPSPRSEQVDSNDPQNYSSSGNRFPKWIALAVLSLVAWLATVGTVQRHQMDRSEKWALSATTLSLVFATLGVLAYVSSARGIFLGIPEVGLAVVILIIWAGGLPVIMNPANSLAIGFSDKLNANLYFSSWMAFFAVIWILGDLAKELYGLDVVGVVSPHARSRRGKWYALIATSIIVLCASVREYRAFTCADNSMSQSSTCRQTKFAISVGVIGCIFAVVATFVLSKGFLSQGADWCSSVIMVVIWSCGLGFITFGSGPGQNIGNLYFSTWASFIISVLLAAESVREYMGMREQATSGTSESVDEDDVEQNSPTFANRPSNQPVPGQSQSFEDADI